MARAQVRAPQTEDQEPQANQDEQEAPEAAAEGSDSPVLDLSDAAVKRMIAGETRRMKRTSRVSGGTNELPPPVRPATTSRTNCS